MAIGIQNYTNIDTSDPTKYPAGNIKDDTGVGDGTPMNVETLGDMNQLLYRALDQAGITPSGDPENATDGYQYGQAFGLEAWQDAGNTPTVGTDVGSITVGTADVVYNKFQLVGRTLKWQVQLENVTISGTPNIIWIELPSYITGMGLTFANDFQHQVNSWDGANSKACFTTFTVSGGFGNDQVYLQRVDGSAFTNGVNNQTFFINIEAELV